MGTARASSERAIYQAMFELLDGAREQRLSGEAEVETAEGHYRFIDGVCFSASDASSIGSELVGWLVEADRASAVLTRFRRGAGAVLVKSAQPRVLAAASALRVGGTPVADGFVTHDGRLVLVHDESFPPKAALATARRKEVEDDPAIELGGMVEVDLPPPSDESNGLEAVAAASEVRPTAPPSDAARAVVAAEAIQGRLDARPIEEPGSYGAPPVWEIPPLSIPRLDPLPSFPLDALETGSADRASIESLGDDDDETDPGGRIVAGRLVRW